MLLVELQSFTMHFIGRVTMLFANNSLMECLITMKYFTHFFLHPDVIFSSHTMFINASTKEFTLVNNAISSYNIAFEELLYYRLASPILWSWHIANNHIETSHRYNIRYQFKSNGHIYIALLLVANCKFDIIIDRTLWTLCNYMT